MKVYQAEVTNRSFRTQSGSRTWKFTPFKLKLASLCLGKEEDCRAYTIRQQNLCVVCLFLYKTF